MAEVLVEEVENTSPSSPSEEPTPSPKANGFKGWLDRYFHISERGSTIARELLGGLVIFLAMFYILPLNSNMLSTDWANLGTVGISAGNMRQVGDVVEILIYGDVWAPAEAVRAGIFAATALSAGITTIFMGFYGKLPVGLASGLGLNSLIAYTVMLGMGYNFAQSMCIVMVDGILFLIISITPLRAWIVKYIPKSLKFAISAGIGFFICFIGFQNVGVIVDGPTLVGLGNLAHLPTAMGLIGIILVFAISVLPQKNKVMFWVTKFGVIIAILIMGIICGSLGSAGVEGFSGFYNDSYHIKELGNGGTVFGAAFLGFDAFTKPMSYALAFSLLFVDFFDTTGTLVGVESGAGMVDKDGRITVDDRPAMIVDAAGTVIGSVFGTTTVTSFVESTTGVAAGARTGLAAVTTGTLFLLSTLIYPALSMFSSSAVTGLALVYVGVCMFKSLESIEWNDWVTVVSSFLTVIMMCVAYSITDGIAVGFFSYTILTAVSGRFKKTDIPVAVCTVAFIAIYAIKVATHLV